MTDHADPQNAPGGDAQQAQGVFAPARTAAQAGAMHQIAARGVAGPAQDYPFAAEIRAGFGQYVPSALTAHMGDAARSASQSLSARAFSYGPRVGFAHTPDLRLAVHEAAHVAAGEFGATAPLGVGHMGDRHEVMADAAAQAVQMGQSAEPILASFLGSTSRSAPAGPQLHMENVVTSVTTAPDGSAKTSAPFGEKTPTPWAQIATQLKVRSDFDWTAAVTRGKSTYGTMVKTLGLATERAKQVKAKIDTIHTGTSADREGSALQTAYGNLGDFMTWVTNNSTLGSFAGGHLVSDKILGKGSYYGWNFAPQNSDLNSPYYRVIEEIAEGGAVYDDAGVWRTSKQWDYTVTLTYDTDEITVPSQVVMDQLGMLDTDLDAPKPSTLNLTTWVPHMWDTKLKVDAEPGSHFSTEKKLDTARTSGADAGYVPGLDEVRALAQPPVGDPTGKPLTTTHRGVVAFSIDNVDLAILGGTATARTSGGHRGMKSEFQWIGVQSPPRGQRATDVYAKATVDLPPAKAPPTMHFGGKIEGKDIAAVLPGGGSRNPKNLASATLGARSLIGKGVPSTQGKLQQALYALAQVVQVVPSAPATVDSGSAVFSMKDPVDSTREIHFLISKQEFMAELKDRAKRATKGQRQQTEKQREIMLTGDRLYNSIKLDEAVLTADDEEEEDDEDTLVLPDLDEDEDHGDSPPPPPGSGFGGPSTGGPSTGGPSSGGPSSGGPSLGGSGSGTGFGGSGSGGSPSFGGGSGVGTAPSDGLSLAASLSADPLLGPSDDDLFGDLFDFAPLLAPSTAPVDDMAEDSDDDTMDLSTLLALAAQTTAPSLSRTVTAPALAPMDLVQPSAPALAPSPSMPLTSPLGFALPPSMSMPVMLKKKRDPNSSGTKRRRTGLTTASETETTTDPRMNKRKTAPKTAAFLSRVQSADQHLFPPRPPVRKRLRRIGSAPKPLGFGFERL